MKVKFYGTRGSIPVCHPDFLEFGGDTTCIKIETESGRFAILDAGTGIREVGREIASGETVNQEIIIAFTHFHWDHIQGFPFFQPAYDPGRVINILALGKGREIKCLEEIFATQMQKEFFPVQLENMGARFNFLLPEKHMEVYENVVAAAMRHDHPGGAYSYRLENRQGRKVVISTDIEHSGKISEEYLDFCRGADLLVHDAQYTSEELENRRGWGHSSYEQAIEIAERAGVRRLIMTHHDPSHTDEFLRKMEKQCQERFRDAMLAREGMEIQV